MVRRGILIGVLVAAWMVGFAVAAEGDARRGHTRCTFVRLTEVQVGEKEFVAMVVRQVEGKREEKLFVPRRNRELLARIKRLREGQELTAAYVTEAEQKWVTAIEADLPDGDRREAGGEEKPKEEGEGERREQAAAERRERADAERREAERREREKLEGGDRERTVEAGDARLREIVEVLKGLRDRLERLEKQVAELREENARLRRDLRERK